MTLQNGVAAWTSTVEVGSSCSPALDNAFAHWTTSVHHRWAVQNVAPTENKVRMTWSTQFSECRFLCRLYAHAYNDCCHDGMFCRLATSAIETEEFKRPQRRKGKGREKETELCRQLGQAAWCFPTYPISILVDHAYEHTCCCHDDMFCRLATSTTETEELKHHQRGKRKGREKKTELCRKLGHAAWCFPTFRFAVTCRIYRHFQHMQSRNFEKGTCIFGDDCKYWHVVLWRWKMAADHGRPCRLSLH